MSSEAVTGEAGVPAQCGEFGLEVCLRNRILGALETAGYPELRSVRCQVDEGVVVLHGVLPSYHLKQVAQHAILALNDGHVVKNLIDVPSRVANASRRGAAESFNRNLR